MSQNIYRNIPLALSKLVESDHMEITEMPRCAIIRGEGSYEGKQGLAYFTGISSDTVAARGICMHLVKIPPGGQAKAHLHENHETAIYMLSGEVELWWGSRLEKSLVACAGDFVYIPAGVPHWPKNRSETEPSIAVLARTDPNEQESVTLLAEIGGSGGP